jgi:hypothetical protein
MSGTSIYNLNSYLAAMIGQSSIFPGNGKPGLTGGSSGGAGSAPGAGGGGATSPAAACTSASGGAGAAGIVIFEW